MTIQENTIIFPTTSNELLEEKERKWRLELPIDYKGFIQKYNGSIPTEKTFLCNNHNYVITRFLCILKNVQESSLGWYDISVVEFQIGERLTDNEDLIGIEILPIAELFSGDYVCLDYREYKKYPSVCVWSHEESGEFNPITYKVANTFSDFLKRII